MSLVSIDSKELAATARHRKTSGPGQAPPEDAGLGASWPRVADRRSGSGHEFYAEKRERPGNPPGVYLRMQMVGYLEGTGSERGTAYPFSPTGCEHNRARGDNASIRLNQSYTDGWSSGGNEMRVTYHRKTPLRTSKRGGLAELPLD